jgi:hypothetical protein
MFTMGGIEAVAYERHFEGPSKNDAKNVCCHIQLLT